MRLNRSLDLALGRSRVVVVRGVHYSSQIVAAGRRSKCAEWMETSSVELRRDDANTNWIQSARSPHLHTPL